jgi:ribosome-associated protein
MRQEEVDAIRHYLAGLDSHRELNTRAFHALEALRERLIKGGNDVIGEVLARHPTADSQKLRQLVRDSKRASDDAAAARHSRELFRFLRALEDHDLTPEAADDEALPADSGDLDGDPVEARD